MGMVRLGATIGTRGLALSANTQIAWTYGAGGSFPSPGFLGWRIPAFAQAIICKTCVECRAEALEDPEVQTLIAEVRSEGCDVSFCCPEEEGMECSRHYDVKPGAGGQQHFDRATNMSTIFVRASGCPQDCDWMRRILLHELQHSLDECTTGGIDVGFTLTTPVGCARRVLWEARACQRAGDPNPCTCAMGSLRLTCSDGDSFLTAVELACQDWLNGTRDWPIFGPDPPRPLGPADLGPP